VSGGPDSICLLHALHGLAPRFSLRLHVAHLHHGQRPEGDSDARFVQEFAENLGCLFTLERADVPALVRTERLSLEMAGRAARYRFFSRLGEEIGAKAVATGHNADDQAETVLMRAFRGAGNPGLRGIPARAPLPESKGAVTVLRPLLSVSRSEIEAYLKEHQLPSIFDSTNLDVSLQRNRIRRELLPLAETISPGARKGLLRIAQEAAEDEEAMEALTMEAWDAAVYVQEFAVNCDLSQLSSLTAIRRRVLRRALKILSAVMDGFPEELVDRLLLLAAMPKETSSTPPALSLSKDLRAVRSGNRLRIEAVAPSPQTKPFRHRVSLPGITVLPEIASAFIVEESERPLPGSFPLRTAWEALIDADRLEPPCVLRSWEPGDSIRVFGSGGTRKLQDLFTEARIPPPERRRWPVFCDAERIVWVPGISLSETVKVTPKTQCVFRLRLKCEREPGKTI
jgi:tRNA(Ile)-lysidine synthase